MITDIDFGNLDFFTQKAPAANAQTRQTTGALTLAKLGFFPN
jgi:hypothetical protein